MRYTLLLCFVLTATFCDGQQDPLYAQYINNPFVINPAYGGFGNTLHASVSYRQQWTGMVGPKTMNVNIHAALRNNMAAGFMVVSDKIGSSKVTEVTGTYTYRIALNAAGTNLAFGLQAGMANYQTDNTGLNIQDPTDPLFQGKQSETVPTLGAGLILNNDRFFVGLSVPRMLKSSVETLGVNNTLYSQHAYALGAYLFFLSDHLRLKPAALVKYVAGAPLSVDLNASLIAHGKYQAGILTRNFNTYGLLFQLIVKDVYRVGYVFEIPTGKAAGSQFTTHEITLGLRMKAFSFHDLPSALSF
ncbi:PorP/SprF family type IX secretion system membrane protein [Chryseolinea lacunae]|uniref:Type IX secretion system membrane protein PorP/SprF n=1 Tax=Chryseolinea lacunae TaxID=2801331 RepID=A0ABS1KK06_9BACT|nr:type IX secretion system membrane protein PorP/SprF [Chryseolinea lacunae]MBL0739799.1 type IX secretion system membrane protein PorP/SprF [Chryseolinea lacunae]